MLHTCLLSVSALGRYQYRIALAPSDRLHGSLTTGNGMENGGGNICSILSSMGPSKPVGRGGRCSLYSAADHGT